ncbi:MAG: glycosyltransferase [Clostridiales bacterium]|nr:glycosyltransferase [Clostridiales bacterium]
MKVSLCIPMYNESSIIDATLKTVSEYMESNIKPEYDYEVIFSDDGSTDGCRAAVDAFPNEHIRSVGYEKNRGKGCAVRTGILAAEGDVVIFTDCDLAYGLDVVKQAAEMFCANPTADMVIGSRNLTKDGYEGYTFIRRLASKIYIKCLAIAAGFRLSDSQCGFKCFRHDAAQKIFSTCEVDGFAFDFEALIKANKLGLKILEMPVKVINHRESKINVLRDSFKMLKDVRGIKKRNK